MQGKHRLMKSSEDNFFFLKPYLLVKITQYCIRSIFLSNDSGLIRIYCFTGCDQRIFVNDTLTCGRCRWILRIQINILQWRIA